MQKIFDYNVTAPTHGVALDASVFQCGMVKCHSRFSHSPLHVLNEVIVYENLKEKMSKDIFLDAQSIMLCTVFEPFYRADCKILKDK